MERDELVIWNVDRLGHALDADPSVSFTGTDRVKVGDHTEERAIATLKPPVLEKLRNKTLFSIREELASLGEEGLADHLIFNGERQKL